MYPLQQTLDYCFVMKRFLKRLIQGLSTVPHVNFSVFRPNDKAVPASHTSWNKSRPRIQRFFYQLCISRPLQLYAGKHPVTGAGLNSLHVYFAQTSTNKPIGAANDT